MATVATETTWKSSKGLRERSDGAVAKRRSDGHWQAHFPNGDVVRCDRMVDGTRPPEPKPWWGLLSQVDRNLMTPPVRGFPSASAAMRYLDKVAVR